MARDDSSGSRDWLRLTVASLGDAVIATDDRGRVMLMNPAAERLTGETGDAARGRLLHQVLRLIDEGTDRPIEIPVSEEALGETGAMAHRALRIAGDPIANTGRRVLLRVEALREDGRFAGAVLALRDVTAEERQEQEIRESSSATAPSSSTAPRGSGAATSRRRCPSTSPRTSRSTAPTATPSSPSAAAAWPKCTASPSPPSWSAHASTTCCRARIRTTSSTCAPSSAPAIAWPAPSRTRSTRTATPSTS